MRPPWNTMKDDSRGMAATAATSSDAVTTRGAGGSSATAGNAGGMSVDGASRAQAAQASARPRKDSAVVNFPGMRSGGLTRGGSGGCGSGGSGRALSDRRKVDLFLRRSPLEHLPVTFRLLRRKMRRCRVKNPLMPFGCIPDRKSTRLNSSHVKISYAVFCLKKKK